MSSKKLMLGVFGLDVILSVHPCFVEKIILGEKNFEYRKSKFKKDVDKVFVYSTSPIKKIVGYFRFSGYIQGTVDYVWGITANESGVEKKFYYEYFKNKSNSYALKIVEFYEFENYLNPKEHIDSFYPPQSYRYLEKGVLKYE